MPQFKPLPITSIQGNIFEINATYSEEPDGTANQLVLRVKNQAGKWVDVNVDRAGGGVSITGHVEDGQSGGFTESLQIYENGLNKITRWAPGLFGVAGNGGGEILFSVPDDALDVVIELTIRG